MPCRRKSERFGRLAFWLVLYAAFVGAAYALRALLVREGLAEIWGWDYGTFCGQINDWRWIAYTGFRHPGLGLLMSPLVALQHVWADAYLWAMPAVAVATAWFIRRLGGWCAVMVWLALPTTWALAGTPESYPLAQLLLVVSVWWLTRETDGRDVRWPGCGRGLTVGAWCLAGVNTLVTLTNGGKVALAWLALHARRKDVERLAAIGFALAILGVSYFALRAQMSGKDWTVGIRATLSWIPAERQVGRELWGFFIRPVGWVALAAYPLALVGLLRARRLAKVLACFFAVDLVIHVVIGWGMDEPWVFAPHWTWMLAILAGKGVERRKRCGTCATFWCPGMDEPANGMAVVARLLLKDAKWKDEPIVHGSWLPSGWCACLRFAWHGGYVRMPHGSYDPVRLAYHGWKKRLVKPIERFLLRRAKKVLATCAAEKEWILAYEPKAKVEVVEVKKYFGVEKVEKVERVERVERGERVNLLYLGRRHPLKGIECLERAVEGLVVNLRIVSDATGEEKEKAWAWCDVLVLPTLSENFGLVVAEALERGKRVIVTDGAPAWGDGDYGGRLTYVRGYRDGSAKTRVELLKTAILGVMK